MRNINTVSWESRNTTTQQGEMNYREAKVNSFVVNACLNIYLKIKERCFFVRSICFIQLKFPWMYIRNMLCKFGVFNGEYIFTRDGEVALNLSMG